MPPFPRFTAAALIVSLGLASAGQGQTQTQIPDDVMVVFDASNSMWGQIAGQAKIEIARNAMGSLLGQWTDSRAVGLMAYGHRRQGDCQDIETLAAPRPRAAAEIRQTVNTLTPRGRTPLTDAVERAARELSYTDRPATVILISDGVESCRRDPCALAHSLEATGVDFTAHIVGFGVAEEEAGTLACIADATGGLYLAAQDAQALNQALTEVSQAIALVEPEPAPLVPDVTLSGPSQAVIGSVIDIAWEVTHGDPADLIALVPAGQPEVDAAGPRLLIRDEISGHLRASSQPGDYILRYIDVSAQTVVAEIALTLTDPPVRISGPADIPAGAAFPVSWEGGASSFDFITIVPVGTPANDIRTHLRARDNAAGQLTAPGETGAHEIRYALADRSRVLAAHPILVVEPEVSIGGPATIAAGGTFDVTWSGAVSETDFITIVPSGTLTRDVGAHIRTRTDTSGRLTAPGQTGAYELRYILADRSRILARQPIAVTDPVTSVAGPGSAVAGAQIDVSWTQPVSDKDFITIVPAGVPAHDVRAHIRTRSDQAGRLTVPGETGAYELRYVLADRSRILASHPITVEAAEISVSAPATALAGAVIDVTWSMTINERDIITIVPSTSPDTERQTHIRTRQATEGRLTVPGAPGTYEVRYLVEAGMVLQARAPVTVTMPEVSLTAPPTAPAGTTLDVSWSQTVNARDFIAIVPAGAPDSDRNPHMRTRDGTRGTLRLPQDPGAYELRYVLEAGGVVLARRPITLTQ